MSERDRGELIIPGIRPMLPGDIEEVYELGNGVHEFSLSDNAEGFWPKDALERWVNSPNDVLLVAIDKDNIIGFAFAMFHPETKQGICQNLYTKEEYRGKGIGKQLYQTMVEQLEAKGATFLYSLVHPENVASIELQRSLGFEPGFLMQTMVKIPRE